MTAASADQWVPVPPGGERYVALGLLRLLAQEGAAGIPGSVAAFTPAAVEARTGVQASVLSAIARHFSAAGRPLALAEGMAFQDPNALETAVAANLLCTLSPESGKLIDFGNPSSLGRTAPASDIKALKDRMAAGNVGALLLYGANPVYNLPDSWEFEKALAKVPLVISLSSFPDETTRHATPYIARRHLPRIMGRLQPLGKRDRPFAAGHGQAFQHDAPGRHHALSRQGRCRAGEVP